jgi:hypothetical protein
VDIQVDLIDGDLNVIYLEVDIVHGITLCELR